MSTEKRHQTTVITGGAGFIGARLVSRLRDHRPDLPLVIPDRSEVDLADRSAVEDLFARLRPAKVVHLAASMAREPGAQARERQWRDTFIAGRNVIEAAADAGVRHLLAAGSIEELGDQEGVLDRELEPRPVTFYGLCKSLLREVAAFHARRSPLRIDWFRPFTVYGPGQRGAMLMPYAFDAASRGAVARFTDGTHQRDFVYVEDLVDWLVAALSWEPSAHGAGGVVVHHLGSGVAVRVSEVLSMIAARFPGAKFELGAIPRRESEAAVQVAPLGQRATPGPMTWSPGTTLEAGIGATADWWRGRVA